EPGVEYEQLRDEILAGLRALSDPETGQPVIQEAYRREEVYRGPYAQRAPDLVFLCNPDYFVEDGPGEVVSRMDSVVARLNRSCHRQDGVLTLAGAGVFRSHASISRADIVDVAPTLLHALGLAVPEDLDGHVLEEAFDPDFLRA